MHTKHENLERLKRALFDRILGQEETLTRFYEAIERCEKEATPPRGPRGRFFFAGPTGVGKTETAKVLAEVLFEGSGFLRIDCSEYKTLESMAGLLGNRSRDRGRLGQAYTRSREGVWLWDEIEKAHPELVQLMLQMADEGRVTLARGETLDLRGLYLILTSNLGSAAIIGRQYLTPTSLERHVDRCIEDYLSPELLARFGKPYMFRPLNALSVQNEIVGQRLGALLGWQAGRGRHIQVLPEVPLFLVHRGFSRKYGARPLLDFIEEMVGNAVVENLRAGGNGSGTLGVKGDQLELVG